MERKSSTESSVVYLGKQKVQVTETSTLEFAVFRSSPDPKYSRASAFCFFLSTTVVFAAVRKHFPRKTTACLVDGTTINKQPFKYNNQRNFFYVVAGWSSG